MIDYMLKSFFPLEIKHHTNGNEENDQFRLEFIIKYH